MMDPLKIEDESLRFSFEDEEEMDREDSTMDLIMEMSKKRQVAATIDGRRNWLPKMEFGGRSINRMMLDDDHVMMMMPEPERSSTKKAVLIGLKHPLMINNNTDDDDVLTKIWRMKLKLMDMCEFPEDNITLMIDHEEPIANNLQPTTSTIVHTLLSLLCSARPGDILYIHLIAYGCSDGHIITRDRYLQDSFFRGLIIVACHKGCNLTFVSDCLIDHVACSCKDFKIAHISPSDFENGTAFLHNNTSSGELSIAGFLMAEPTNLSSVDILNTPNEEKKKNDDDDDDSYSGRVILFTPFPPVQNAATMFNQSELFIQPPNGLICHPSTYGVLTNAILHVIEETHGQLTNLELAQKAMNKLGGEGGGIIPTLRCSDHNHAYTSFLC